MRVTSVRSAAARRTRTALTHSAGKGSTKSVCRVSTARSASTLGDAEPRKRPLASLPRSQPCDSAVQAPRCERGERAQSARAAFALRKRLAFSRFPQGALVHHPLGGVLVWC